MKRILLVLTIFLLTISFVAAIPTINVPLVVTPDSQQVSNPTVSASNPVQVGVQIPVSSPKSESSASGSNIDSISSKLLKWDESIEEGTITSSVDEILQKNLKKNAGIQTNDIENDDINLDTSFSYYGKWTSPNINYNSKYYQVVGSWNPPSGWYVFHMVAPRSDLDMRLYWRIGGTYVKVVSSTRAGSNEMMTYYMYHGQTYKFQIYRYSGSPGYMTVPIKYYRATGF